MQSNAKVKQISRFKLDTEWKFRDWKAW